MRDQFCHVIDVAPTILEAGGLPEPTQVHGVTQKPMRRLQHGLQLRRRRRARAPRDAVLRDVLQPRHLPRGLVRGDQAPHAVGVRPRRAVRSTRTSGSSTTARKDWTQAHDLADEMPDKLHELQRLFLIEAAQVQRAAARRPPGRAHQPGDRGPPDADQAATRRCSIDGHGSAPGELHAQPQEQVALGHRRGRRARRRRRRRASSTRAAITGGWSLYLKDDGRVAFTYNFLRHAALDRVASEPLRARQAPGADGVRLRRRRCRQGRRPPRCTSTATRSPRRASSAPTSHNFTFDETTDVGRDTGSPVTDDYADRRQRVHRLDRLGPDRPRRRLATTT